MNAILPAGTPTFTGREEGLTVEVAVEQFNSFVGGRVPTSGDMAFANGRKQHFTARSTKVGKEKKGLGLALADESVGKYCSGTSRSNEDEGWKDSGEEVDALSMTKCGILDGSDQGFHPQTGASNEVKSDLRGELPNNGDDPHLKASNTDVAKQPVTSTSSTDGNTRAQCSGSLVICEDPGQKPKFRFCGDNGDFSGVKRKRRFRVTSNPKHYYAAVMAPTSGITMFSIYWSGRARVRLPPSRPILRLYYD